MSETTEGSLLAGRVSYRQFKTGHRTGFEPVLLAAAVNARPGDLVLEAGTGAGAALLCLGTRVKALAGIGIEIDASLVNLANENFKNNGLKGFSCVVSDAALPPFAGIFDHVLANPPWFDPASTQSPDDARARAHHAREGLLEAWVAGLAGCLKPRGGLYLILPAATLSTTVAVLRRHHFSGLTFYPLWQRASQPAGQIIVSAGRMGNAPDRLLPGLILHGETGITPQANAILREGAPITLAAYRGTPHKSVRSHPPREPSYPRDD